MSFLPDEDRLRAEIVEAGQRLYFKNLVAACDGNISARLGPDEYLVTPTGVSKGFFTAGQILTVRGDGTVVSGDGRPTREVHMHLAVYRARPDVCGVVHAHPPTATAYACVKGALDRVLLPEVVFGLGEIRQARYALPTTDQVPASILKVLTPRCNAILLSNHGAVTLGTTVMQAYYNMETLEAVAMIDSQARAIGMPRYLTRPQVRELWTLKNRTTG